MTGVLPRTWSEIFARLAVTLGGGPAADAAGREWIRQSVEAAWGGQDVSDLTRVQRQVALQRASGALLLLEEMPGDLAFHPGMRALVCGAFDQYFLRDRDRLFHVKTKGPPWRLSPTEEDRPMYEQYLAAADFGPVPS